MLWRYVFIFSNKHNYRNFPFDQRFILFQLLNYALNMITVEKDYRIAGARNTHNIHRQKKILILILLTEYEFLSFYRDKVGCISLQKYTNVAYSLMKKRKCHCNFHSKQAEHTKVYSFF